MLIEARELYRFHHLGGEEVKALRGVDFSLAPGEFVALVGPSGSGKSTLLDCLAGLDDPDGGMVTVEGRPISRQPEAVRRKIRRGMGLMRQKGNLLPHLTVTENVLEAQSVVGRGDLSEVLQLLEEMGIAHRAGACPPALSGGERARAGLAVALAARPRILLLDEPTGEVDAATEAAIVNLLRARCAAGVGLVAATHNPALGKAASRTVGLAEGKVLHA
jgi:putative ABC transport system ATP-binding protein